MKVKLSGSGERVIRLGQEQKKKQRRSGNFIQDSRAKWEILWKKIRKGDYNDQKKSNLKSSSYDQISYAQNFDHGTAWQEPDNLSRSFSARFAHPSRIINPISLIDI